MSDLPTKGCACGHPVHVHGDPDESVWVGCLLCFCKRARADVVSLAELAARSEVTRAEA